MNILTDTVRYGFERTHLSKEEPCVPTKFSERLKALRAEHGYKTQRKLAEALTAYMASHRIPGDERSHRVSQQQITEWETGKYLPSALGLSALAGVLDVTIDYLLGLVDDRHSHLTEEGLSDQELLLVRRVRQHPELVALLYKMLSIEPPRDAPLLGSGTESGK